MSNTGIARRPGAAGRRRRRVLCCTAGSASPGAPFCSPSAARRPGESLPRRCPRVVRGKPASRSSPNAWASRSRRAPSSFLGGHRSPRADLYRSRPDRCGGGALPLPALRGSPHRSGRDRVEGLLLGDPVAAQENSMELSAIGCPAFGLDRDAGFLVQSGHPPRPATRPGRRAPMVNQNAAPGDADPSRAAAARVLRRRPHTRASGDAR